jgi:hypothetical protein
MSKKDAESAIASKVETFVPKGSYLHSGIKRTLEHWSVGLKDLEINPWFTMMMIELLTPNLGSGGPDLGIGKDGRGTAVEASNGGCFNVIAG